MHSTMGSIQWRHSEMPSQIHSTMDSIIRFYDLFAYNHWSNDRIIETLGSGDSLKLFAHILGAERVWLDRLRGEETPFVPWPDLTINECRKAMEQLRIEWKTYIDSLPAADLERGIDYRNTKGEEFTTAIGDILTHVVNHGTYHRAQVAREVARAGGKPAVTDYIAYVRAVR